MQPHGSTLHHHYERMPQISSFDYSTSLISLHLDVLTPLCLPFRPFADYANLFIDYVNSFVDSYNMFMHCTNFSINCANKFDDCANTLDD